MKTRRLLSTQIKHILTTRTQTLTQLQMTWKTQFSHRQEVNVAARVLCMKYNIQLTQNSKRLRREGHILALIQ